MIFLDLPTINGSGTTEQQLSEIRSYIYKNNEQINSALSNLTIDKIWEQTASAVSSANQSEDETPKILKQYQRIRDLIIKTADVVAQSDEKMKMAFNGSYLAKSQFGEYFKQTKVEIEGTPVGINELYNYSTKLETGLETYKLDYECYIKRGLLTDATNPIYGIELGVLEDTIILYDEHGEPVNHNLESNKHFKTRITPDKWSFYQGNTEVAYIDANAIHFPAAQITGGSIDIGANHEFKVLSDGTMTATKGKFSGSLTAENVSTAWNSKSGGIIKLETENGAPKLNIFDGAVKDFSVESKGIMFYKRNTVDDVMAKFMRDTFSGAAQNDSHWGMKLKLRRAYAEYLSIEEYDDPGQSKKALVFVPNSVETVISPPSPYDNPGLYIDTNLYIWNRNQAKFVTTPANTTIKISASQIWGAVDGSNVDVYIDITQGIITRISTTAT
jgi:hypothetical protein